MERIDVEALRGQLNKKLNEIEDQFIGIDEIEDKSYMDDRGGLEEANRIAERMEQYGEDEESQLLRNLDEGYLRLKSVREAKIIRKMKDDRKEDAKKEFVLELKKRQEERNARIQEIDEKVENLEKIRKEKLESQEEHENAKKVLKDSFKKLDNKIFKDIDGSIKKYADAVKKKDEEIATLKQEKAECEEDNTKLDDLINEINGVDKNIVQEEVAEEVETAEETPATLEQEATVAPELETEKSEEVAPKETEKLEEVTPKETEKLEETPATVEPEVTTPEVEAKKQEEVESGEKTETPTPESEKTELKQMADEFKKRKQVIDYNQRQEPNIKKLGTESKTGIKFNPTQYTYQGQKVKSVEMPTEDIEKTNKITGAILKSISFYVGATGKPVYRIVLQKDDQQIEYQEQLEYDDIKVLDVDSESDLYEELKKEKIEESQKYYDANVDALLKRLDAEHNNGKDKGKILGAYRNIMKYKSLPIDRRPKSDVAIEYDFSNLYNFPKEEIRQKIKYLENIAKNSAKNSMLKYQKKPNVFGRLYKMLSELPNRIKTKKLESKTAKDLEVSENPEELEDQQKVPSAHENFRNLIKNLGKEVEAVEVEERDEQSASKEASNADKKQNEEER